MKYREIVVAVVGVCSGAVLVYCGSWLFGASEFEQGFEKGLEQGALEARHKAERELRIFEVKRSLTLLEQMDSGLLDAVRLAASRALYVNYNWLEREYGENMPETIAKDSAIIGNYMKELEEQPGDNSKGTEK